MKLTRMLAGVSGISLQGSPETSISGIAYSSSDARSGFLFAALKGEKADGNDFVNKALANGAVAVLSERTPPPGFEAAWIKAENARKTLALLSSNFYGHPSLELQVVGVTGTKGKTTVTYLLESILQQAGQKTGVIGTISYRGPGFMQEAKRTTPEAPDIQKMLRQMRDHGATHCLLEVSSHSLAFKRVEGVGFDAAVFTNLSGEHLDYHKTMDNYFAVKKQLFSTGPKKAMAVINTDDSWGKKLKAQLPGGIISYGLGPQAMVRAERFDLTDKGIDLHIKFPAGRMSLLSPLLGKPNVYNILAAVASAFFLKIPLPTIKEGIRALKGVPGRFQRIANSRGLAVFVDYAHTDDALRKLLETARDLHTPKTILVFGAGGDRDRSKRERMGKAAGSLADWTIITSDNPRSEDPLSIIADIERGILTTGKGKYEIISDRRQAIAKALRMGHPGDYILIAGKGHENTQTIGDDVLHFDDAEVIRELLAEREAV